MYGNCATSCPVETLNNGRGILLFRRAHTPPSDSGNGGAPAENDPLARDVPLMFTAPPSATKLLRSAAFTMLETTGLASSASKVAGNTVRPEADSTKIRL